MTKRERVPHDLPMLRVHRAWEAAEKIAEREGVNRGVALAIAREVVDIVGEGTQRWGRLCAECRSLVKVEDGHLVCPNHGRLYGPFGQPSTVLLISFDPITD